MDHISSLSSILQRGVVSPTSLSLSLYVVPVLFFIHSKVLIVKFENIWLLIFSKPMSILLRSTCKTGRKNEAGGALLQIIQKLIALIFLFPH